MLGNGDVVVVVPSGGGVGGGEDDGYVGDASDVSGGGGGVAGVANAGTDAIDVSGGRGSDWWFYDSAVRRKMARGVPVFRDESLFSDLSDLSITAGSSAPWSREASRAAAEHVRSLLTSSGAAPGHETEDAPAYRFFVGGAACQDVDVYLQLVATSGMCDLYRDALNCDPREHGAAP